MQWNILGFDAGLGWNGCVLGLVLSSPDYLFFKCKK